MLSAALILVACGKTPQRKAETPEPVSSSKSDAAISVNHPGPIAYEVTGFNDFRYQSFLNNWNHEKYPTFYALIRNAQEYDKLFTSAAIMGKNKPFSPPDSLYTTQHLLTVAKVVHSSGKLIAFTVDSLYQRDQELFLYYRYSEEQPLGSMLFKNGLVIQIPHLDIQKINLFENAKQVGSLDLTIGNAIPME